jgi:hypothetical protein
VVAAIAHENTGVEHHSLMPRIEARFAAIVVIRNVERRRHKRTLERPLLPHRLVASLEFLLGDLINATRKQHLGGDAAILRVDRVQQCLSCISEERVNVNGQQGLAILAKQDQ